MSPESQRGHPESVRRPVFVVSRFEAVIFDMDGVVTDTAQLHSRCWKRVFDEFLRARSPDGGDLPECSPTRTTSCTSTANPATTE